MLVASRVRLVRGCLPAAWFLGVLLTACSGCGAKDAVNRQAIAGKVTFHGSPLDAGSIQFMPEKEQDGFAMASGATITNGEYSIPQERGLPAGVYKVMISSAGSVPASDAQPGEIAAPMEERIPPEYNVNGEHSITVVAGETKPFNFDIP